MPESSVTRPSVPTWLKVWTWFSATAAVLAGLVGPVLWIGLEIAMDQNQQLPPEQSMDGPGFFGAVVVVTAINAVSFCMSVLFLGFGGWRASKWISILTGVILLANFVAFLQFCR